MTTNNGLMLQSTTESFNSTDSLEYFKSTTVPTLETTEAITTDTTNKIFITSPPTTEANTEMIATDQVQHTVTNIQGSSTQKVTPTSPPNLKADYTTGN